MTNPTAPGPLAAIKTAIRAHLRASGRSQDAVARQVGISHKHISEVLTGKATGSADTLARLAEAVGLSLVAVRPGQYRAEVAEEIARAIETSVCGPARQCREHPCADCHRFFQAQQDAGTARRIGGVR